MLNPTPTAAPPPSKRATPRALTFGTYRLDEDAAGARVRAALEAGVRAIDTAQLYRNEAQVFEAVRAFERAHPGAGSIHVTTKIHRSLPFEQAVEAVKESADKLGRPIDTMLLHRPLPTIVWRALHASMELGLVREIGVSNYTVAQLQELLAFCNASRLASDLPACPPPAVNQVELHPFVGSVQSLLTFCRAKGVRVQGHTVLTRGERLDFPPLVRLAERRGLSPAAVLLRWAHQLGAQLVFQTSSEAHLREVLDSLHTAAPDLSRSDMAQISGFHAASTHRFIHPPPVARSHPELAQLERTDAYVDAVVRLLRADLAALREGAPISEAALCLHTRTNHQLLSDPIARRIALELFPLEPGKRAMSSHQRYRDAVRALRASLHAADEAGPKKKRSCSLPADHAALRPLPVVKGAPVSAAIAEPSPMPVEVAPRAELAPFFSFVADPAGFFGDGGAPVDEASAITFPRGTFFADQRMDLCKQVVGPDHIGALTDAVRAQAAQPLEGPFRVRHFLLGNNIACAGASTRGAEAMASLMVDPRLAIETWYLAGNRVGPADAAILAEALRHDTSAKALWLKRNAIGAEGARHLGRMLGINRTLALLDLHNCGLFDEGVEALSEGVTRAGGAMHLRHLYISANALTERSVLALERTHASGGLSSLRSLHISINRLHNAGLEALTAWIETGALADLRRLDVGSNGLRRPDLARFVDALITRCPRLRSLDLGTYKSTRDLGETANALDPDVSELVRLLGEHPALELLDVALCDLPRESVARLVEALGSRQSLEGVGPQALHHSHAQRRVLKHAARVRHIDSIYRGRD